MNKQKLKDLVDVSWWVYVRMKSWKEVISFNANDFDEYGELKNHVSPSVIFSSFPEKHLLQDQDVLLVVKWTKFFSVLYRKEYWPAIASTAFMILRINNKNELLPEYLQVYMNEALQSAYFKNRTRWSSLLSLSRKVIEEYEVPIPSIQYQRQMIDIYQEHIDQVRILKELKQKKKKHISGLILSIS